MLPGDPYLLGFKVLQLKHLSTQRCDQFHLRHDISNFISCYFPESIYDKTLPVYHYDILFPEDDD